MLVNCLSLLGMVLSFIFLFRLFIFSFCLLFLWLYYSESATLSSQLHKPGGLNLNDYLVWHRHILHASRGNHGNPMAKQVIESSLPWIGCIVWVSVFAFLGGWWSLCVCVSLFFALQCALCVCVWLCTCLWVFLTKKSGLWEQHMLHH